MYQGYIYCTTKGCSLKGKKHYLFTEADVDQYFSTSTKPAKKHLPKCPECGNGKALWSRSTQDAFNKVFFIPRTS